MRWCCGRGRKRREYEGRVLAALSRIEARLGTLSELEELGMTLDEVLGKVTEQATVVGSAVTLLGDLKRMLDEAIASGDPLKIQAVSDAIGANTDALVAAVVANTPVPAPVP
jgi:hypothetical protein